MSAPRQRVPDHVGVLARCRPAARPRGPWRTGNRLAWLISMAVGARPTLNAPWRRSGCRGLACVTRRTRPERAAGRGAARAALGRPDGRWRLRRSARRPGLWRPGMVTRWSPPPSPREALRLAGYPPPDRDACRPVRRGDLRVRSWRVRAGRHVSAHRCCATPSTRSSWPASADRSKPADGIGRRPLGRPARISVAGPTRTQGKARYSGPRRTAAVHPPAVAQARS